MKYYSEDQVNSILKQQRDICADIITINNCYDWETVRHQIYKSRVPDLPLYKFDIERMDEDNHIRLKELIRLRQVLEIKGTHARTVLHDRMNELTKLTNYDTEKLTLTEYTLC